MSELISRQAAIDNLISFLQLDEEYAWGVRECLNSLPSVQSEPLTDKEQRIFLAAMGREIERKVEKALWTN